MRIIQVRFASDYLEQMLKPGEFVPHRVVKGLPPDAKLCAVEMGKDFDTVTFHFATADTNGPQFENLYPLTESYHFHFPEEKTNE